MTLQLQELSQDKIEEMVVNDELDVGIAFDQVHSADIDAQPLLTENPPRSWRIIIRWPCRRRWI